MASSLLTARRHHVTSAPIFVTLNKQDWISTEQKIRMLEWKIRLDIVQYIARGSPKLSVEKIARYVPKDEASSANRKLFSSFSLFPVFPGGLPLRSCLVVDQRNAD